MYNGIINVYKEPGYTSFDVVAILRKILKQKKIGHTGTLDPQAEGVLPVCLGNGTKLVDMFTEKTKVYKCVMQLGVTTDTEDMEGKVLSQSPVTATEVEIRNAIMSFVRNDYMQVPPMYSALKQDGKKLYELAREGVVVERKARKISIYDITIDDITIGDGLCGGVVRGDDARGDDGYENDAHGDAAHGNIALADSSTVTFTVRCSKGTYVRSLCRDIGEKLGCGACMKHLTRKATGPFDESTALKLNEIKLLAESGDIESKIITTEDALCEYSKIQVLPEYKIKIDNGNPVPIDGVSPVTARESGVLYRTYNVEGQFVALYEYNSDKDALTPYKMFPVQ